jgi:hypothetical protein
MELVVALQMELHCVYRKSEGTEITLSQRFVKYEVSTMTNMKTTVFWDVMLSNLVESYQNFKRTSCLHHKNEF